MPSSGTTSLKTFTKYVTAKQVASSEWLMALCNHRNSNERDTSGNNTMPRQVKDEGAIPLLAGHHSLL